MGNFREPLIIPFLAFAGGIALSSSVRLEPVEMVLAFVLFALAGMVARHRAPRLAWLAWAFCVAAAGSWHAETHRRGPAPELASDIEEILLVSGCVVDPLSIQDGRGRFAIEIEPGARANVSFRVDESAPPPQVRFGEMVEFPARIRKPRNYGNPGAFDYVGYLARRNTYWLAVVQTRAEIKPLNETCGSAFDKKINEFRQAALARLSSLYPPGGDGFMRALILGEDDRLEQETTDEFRRTGTYHAIVISGLHISLVAGSILWLLHRLFIPLWLRLILAGVIAWAYTVAAGSSVPVIRATVGFTLALAAASMFRSARVLNILAAVALGFLLWDPGQLFEPSFQLSFAAVAAIGGLAGPIVDRTVGILSEAAGNIDRVRPSSLIPASVSSLRVELKLLAETVAVVCNIRLALALKIVSATSRLLAACAEMILLSAVIQFALTVPAILYFHRIPVTGVIANLFAVPLLNLAVGFGLSGLVLGSAALSSIAAWFVHWAEAAVAAFARIEPTLRIPTPQAWLVIGFLLALTLTATLLRVRPRMAAIPGFASAVLAGAMCFYDASPGQTGWLEMTAIDVAQGDSLLIVFPNGQTMLVDGGGFPVFRGSTARRLDIGENVVSPYLWQRGLRRLDVVAMTHAHEDHSQGLNAVVRNFRPSQLWTGAVGGPAGDLLLAEAKTAGARLVQPQAGFEQKFGGATVRVLAPAVGYVPLKAAKNDDSLVLEVTYGHRRFVLTGDAEKNIEWELAGSGSLRSADVLKVGHHGSKSSSTPEFLAAIRPAFAVISVGEGNRYGHPSPDVLSRFDEMHSQVFRTDRFGLTTFRTDGNALTAETYSPAWRRN